MRRLPTLALLVLFAVSVSTAAAFWIQDRPANGTQTVKEKAKSPSSLSADNPFAAPSKLALHAPAFDTIKVDKGFTESIEEPEAAALVWSVTQIGNGLAMAAVAEGVERHGQAETLRAIGVEYAQGYLYARPSPKEQLPEIVSGLASGLLGSADEAGPGNIGGDETVDGQREGAVGS